MPYDLLIKNGRIVDGTGAPATTATSLSRMAASLKWETSTVRRPA